MISENQIRKFNSGELPDIKVNHFSVDKNAWMCVFQEDFKFPYIHLTKNQIEERTKLVK